MRTLNRAAADALRPFAPNAVTDVTGFGLLGHAYEMASRSNVRIELDAAALPALPGAFELASDGTRTGGDRRNRDYAGPHVESTAPAAAEALAFDPQTAGGLLVSLPADKACRSRCQLRRPRARALSRRPRRRGIRSRVAMSSSETADTVKTARVRRVVSPRRFLQLASVTLFTLWVVVTSGAVVRLTASGLGCDNWPRCGDKPYPETGGHAAIEFGNRMVALVGIVLTLITWLAARRVDGLPRWVRDRRAAHGARHDRPDSARRGHRAARPAPRRRDVTLPARASRRGRLRRRRDRGLEPLSRATLRRPVLHGSGRSPGSASRPAPCSSSRGRCRRLPALTRAARTSAASGSPCTTRSTCTCARPLSTGSCSSSSASSSGGSARSCPGIAWGGALLLGVLLVQMAVGEIQYRNALPWWLVAIHVSLAATIWVLTIGIAWALHRPPAPLVAADRR